MEPDRPERACPADLCRTPPGQHPAGCGAVHPRAVHPCAGTRSDADAGTRTRTGSRTRPGTGSRTGSRTRPGTSPDPAPSRAGSCTRPRT